jgi:Tfp pilus assembly protein FimV
MEAPAPATPEVASAPAPAPAPAPVAVAPAPQMESGGATDSIMKQKMNVKDMVLSGILIVMAIYGIVYYRKAIKSLDETPTLEEFDNMAGDVEEVKLNVKKALGKKYQTI